MTPIRRQYLDVKRRFPDAVVLFRLGDFYETFDDDAALCARELNLTLTSRPLGKGERIPMAGIPHHALNGYLGRLIARGHRVAICDQIGDPNGRTLVERQVTRVVTPGTVVTDDLLRGDANNFLAALVSDGERGGLAYVDISTGEFAVTEDERESIEAETARVAPAELLLPPEALSPEGWQGAVTRRPAVADAAELLAARFGAAAGVVLEAEERPLAVAAAALVLAYLAETRTAALAQLDRIRAYGLADQMRLDRQTSRNLELFRPARGEGGAASLIAAIDRTRTAMGARLLRSQLGQPLLAAAAIDRRLDSVSVFVEDGLLRATVREGLAEIPDLERLITRTAARLATPRDLRGLWRGLVAAAGLRARLPERDGLLPALPDCGDAAALIDAAIAADPPPALDAGGVIREGFNAELDEYRGLMRDARQVLLDLERRERESTGIRSLKVAHNRVYGYYFEITAANLALVPDHYQRRQAVSGGERFITPELKEYESRVAGAQERVTALEAALFRQVCEEVAAHARPVRALAGALAAIDLAASHAEVAVIGDYCRPVVDEGDAIEIVAGRHPVVEQVLPPGSFVPNDCLIGAERQITILTGPNMAGKSTYLRQVALIVLLAQIGSYVPAASARIGIADRIFTRVGAQDDLAAGNSTFMVEMVETAQILHGATPRSLVILDEVGRGTSTYDGLAIARAVVEYLHNNRQAAARTLFATHYHELSALQSTLPRVTNASVAVIEQDGEVVFLRRIVAGGADRSYGIHVARLAGLPRVVVQRASEILADLESRKNGGGGKTRRRGEGQQLSLFAATSPLVTELAELDVDALSPLEALTTLYELRNRARGGQQ